ncbi:MAG: ribonuclease-3 [Planctomycetota bacterium]|jgi:ribonuclease-3
MSLFGHHFSDPSLLALALTHASTEGPVDNERMEFLGDAALDLVVAEELYRHHADLQEGELTRLKARVVSRASLAEVGRLQEIGSHAKFGPGLAGKILSRAVLANLVEAVLGAIYLDAGLEAVRDSVCLVLADALQEVREQRTAPPPKQALQQITQERWGRPPIYELMESRGQAHARAFLIQAKVGEQVFPSAWGRTRKEAEGWAAAEALLALQDEDSGDA